MFQQENYEVQPKRKLSPGETIQIVFLTLVLINTSYLLNLKACPLYQLFNYFLFFGSVTWAIFILMTITVTFKNQATQKVFNIVDWIFMMFMTAMFIWANVLYWRNPSTCSLCWEWWVQVFMGFGYVAFAAVICYSFMCTLAWWNKKRILSKNPDGLTIQHHSYENLDVNLG